MADIVPRGAIDACVQKARFATDMEMGDRQRALSQSSRQQVECLPPSFLRLIPFFIVPEQIGLPSMPFNPAVPLSEVPPARYRPLPGPFKTATIGVGPKRVYLDIQSQPPNLAYPPRPVPGSLADLDIVMKHCDFSQQKVRSRAICRAPAPRTYSFLLL
jgi:hypothetical protein